MTRPRGSKGAVTEGAVTEGAVTQGAGTQGAGTEGAPAQGRVYDYGGLRLFDTHSWKTAFV